MKNLRFPWLGWISIMAMGAAFWAAPALAEPPSLKRGLCVVVGRPESVTALTQGNELKVYFQSASADEVLRVRQMASAAGILGTRVFAVQGDLARLYLGDNLADCMVVDADTTYTVAENEILRVLHPEGVATIGARRLVKARPEGLDVWSHVYHAPDNNPLSTDRLARAPYLTQFLATPLFCPMPEVSVAAGGRVFRAFGHIAHKANQNALLNTLLGINGYNGTILWERPLHEGFMIHRNTMIATSDILYLGDDESCKMLDARTGNLKDQIVVPAELSDGPVWKWMAIEGGHLFALAGARETRPASQPSTVTGLGHWPWGMWEGHDYKDVRTNFGFGRTLLAIDLATKRIVWSHREEDYIDARGVCMKNGRIYYYGPGKGLGCLDAATGRVAWKNSSGPLLEAIGRDGRAQLWVTGYATATFMKCTDRYLFLAGPQRSRLVVASTEDGKLLWQKEPGNLQLVLCSDAIYAAGPEKTFGLRLDYATGEELGVLPARRACTRATGTTDSIFFRATEGTVRFELASGTAKHIAPMRPPCQDGVIVSDGLLYWGPWMCGCPLSLYGHICLGPAGSFNFHTTADETHRTTVFEDRSAVKPLETHSGDWPTFLHDNAHTGATDVRLPNRVSRQWTYHLPGTTRPTAPITAGGLVFVGDESGAVRALNAADGSLCWQAYTGGAVFFPPALSNGRLYVGSADGRVYAFEAATGRPLWTFRAAPVDRWIPVYGRLISTWPVAGGVTVRDGIVYAAAGISHYDGTYVWAIDGITGRVKWCNDSSGRISEKVDSGISLQGFLSLVGDELRFLGGGKYETARYDLATGACLNTPDDTLTSRYHTAFSAWFPQYGRYSSLSHHLPDGKEVAYDATYEGSQHTRLSLLDSLPPGISLPAKNESRWPLNAAKGPKRPVLWADKTSSRFHGFVVTPGVLLAAGHSTLGSAEEPFLVALDMMSGVDVWREKLPCATVRSGVAVDHEGRIIVAMENGQITTFGRVARE